MEQVKIGLDQNKLSEGETTLYQYNAHLKRIKQAYDALGLRPLTTKDLSSLFTGEPFIKKVLLEGTDVSKALGVKLSQEKINDLVSLPNGSEALFSEIKSFIDYQKTTRASIIFLSDFEVIKNEIVFPESQKKLEDRCSVYIEEPRRIELYKVLKEICTLLNGCKFEHPFIGGDRSVFAGAGRYIVMENGEYTINIDVLRRA